MDTKMKNSIGKLIIIVISFALLALLTRSFPGHSVGQTHKKETIMPSYDVQEIIKSMDSVDVD